MVVNRLLQGRNLLTTTDTSSSQERDAHVTAVQQRAEGDCTRIHMHLGIDIFEGLEVGGSNLLCTLTEHRVLW